MYPLLLMTDNIIITKQLIYPNKTSFPLKFHTEIVHKISYCLKFDDSTLALIILTMEAMQHI
ncbi:protein of unknown function [Vibrio tapetis subsp. tapetis]|uniref:Uncharacterized protein n=1 Tax=Vibrio tapetis subsp. tapetis TaxID=1671868 RepID=A0A2N8ZLB9_9VIBR|nr:protein of unknown function [Vibrio tapetis subsp. tapetis]